MQNTSFKLTVKNNHGEFTDQVYKLIVDRESEWKLWQHSVMANVTGDAL